jgi:Zn-dependent protease
LLCGFVMLLASLRFGVTASEHLGVMLTTVGFSSHRMQAAFAFMKLELPWAEKTQWAQELYWQMVYINLMWGLVNLLPIWPLDGGRFSEIVLTSYDRGRGQRWNHVLSLLVSGCLAAFIYMRTQSVSNSIFFGVFALMNYQQLQQMQQSSSMGYTRDDDWWRR